MDALRLQLVGDGEAPLVTPHSEDLEAYTLYLKGRFFFHKSTEPDLRNSLESYQQALTHDARYARAYAGIADSWMNLADDYLSPHTAYPQAKVAALKALEIDEELAEANTALGKVLGWYEWNFDAAELALRRAVASNPNYADAHWGLGTILPATGRLEEALFEMRMALTLDPLSPIFNHWVARFLLYLGRDHEVIEACRKALELDVAHWGGYLWLAHALLRTGHTDAAVEAFENSARYGGIMYHKAYVALVYARVERTTEARALLDELEKVSSRYLRLEALAAAYGALGELDRAFDLLDRAYREHSAGLIYLHIDPAYDALRADPRFAEFVRKIGLR